LVGRFEELKGATIGPHFSVHKRSRGISSAGVAMLALVLGIGVVSTVYVTSTQSSADQLGDQSKQIATLNQQLQQLVSEQKDLNSSVASIVKTLPFVDQSPTIRTIRETWYLSTSAHQDRFDPAFIVVNQGDEVRLTLIDNDTVAHDFVVGAPYNIIVNATVPGLINDLTGQIFDTYATNNSPGVVVKGIPGNVSATYTFRADYSGIYEFVCTYHAEVGMIGYLAVLPNEAFSGAPTTTQTTATGSPQSVAVSILTGAGGNKSNLGYTPDRITVVVGVNNTVIWTNNDVSTHTVSSTSVPAGTTPFDSGLLVQGATFSFTFTTPGVYEYHCLIHPWMTGTVVVKG
jgi:plastocyanin